MEHDKTPGMKCWCGQHNPFPVNNGIAWLIYLPFYIIVMSVLWTGFHYLFG